MKDISYTSSKMRSVIEQVNRICGSQSPALIYGEIGTEKEEVAKYLFEKKKSKSYFKVDCEDNVEFEKNLRSAHSNEVVFFDNVEKISSENQDLLFAFIKVSKSYIISSTTDALETKIARGHYREDLFYRLNSIIISIPSLRQRKEDIPLFVNKFLSKRVVSPEAMDKLCSLILPGNITQLKNICEQLSLTVDGVIQPMHIPEDVPSNIPIPYHPEVPLSKIEEIYVCEALAHNSFNLSETSRRLDIGMKDLHTKINSYGGIEAIKKRQVKNKMKESL